MWYSETTTTSRDNFPWVLRFAKLAPALIFAQPSLWQLAQLQDYRQKLARLEPTPDNFELAEQMRAKMAPIMTFE